VRRFERQLKRHLLPVRYGQQASVDGFAGSVRFHEGGHILGSTSIELETKQSRLLFSGDLGRTRSSKGSSLARWLV
jgi:Cft2 family RNA processing exonuclease